MRLDLTGQGQQVISTLYKSELLFRTLLDKLPVGAYTCDSEGLITYYNQHAVQLWGREPSLNDPGDRFCGSFKLFSKKGVPINHNECWMALALKHGREFNGCEIIVERPDGQRLTALAHANPIWDEVGVLVGAVNVLVDISERKQLEEVRQGIEVRLRHINQELEARVNERTAALEQANAQLFHNAFHDSLTGLSNRAFFIDRLEQTVGREKHDPARMFAVLYLDFDRFKVVNDSFGHAVGDKLLAELGMRLKCCVRPEDTLARLGGDEFVMLLEGADRGNAVCIAQRI